MKDLGALARAWAIQPSFVDVFGGRRTATPEALLGLVRALDESVQTMADVPAALRARNEALWGRLCEPVTVAWEGTVPALRLRVPYAASQARVTITLEDGGERAFALDVRALQPVSKEGERLEVLAPLPPDLPQGYHDVEVTVGAQRATTMLIHAPARATPWDRRSWGVFVPLYALRTASDWGAGDLDDLAELLRWIGTRGGDLVATLPLLATFADNPSPYSPISRLFWNELWIAIERAPELASNDEARSLLASPALRNEIERLRSAPRVDYPSLLAVKRQALALLARNAELAPADAELDAYARFRAAAARRDVPWRRWEAGAIDDGDPNEYRLHVYAQRLAERQLDAIDDEDAALLFDLPLGVHGDGFDTWRHPRAFALEASGGAPPDTFFTKGQNWGFPPLHPERVREERYAYPIASLRNLMRHARALRIDHVIGFHRLWWVPEGAEPSDGAYVRYHPDEWYAIVTLESRRNGCALVGEDLGTVPREVRRTMERRGLLRMHVVELEARPVEEDPLPPAPEGSVASINTHDMHPFASFWRGLDIEQRREMGLFDASEAAEQRAERAVVRRALARLFGVEEEERAVLRATHRHLAAGRARAVVVTLEDLWGETEPQNVPGTGVGFGNWERKGRYALEELRSAPDILEMLDEIEKARR